MEVIISDVINSVILKQGTESYYGFSRSIESKFDYTLVECVYENKNDNVFLLIISQPRDRNYRGTSITLGYELIRDKIIELGLLCDIDINKVKWFDHYERKRGDVFHPDQDITPVEFNEKGTAEFDKVIYTKEFIFKYGFNIEENLDYF